MNSPFQTPHLSEDALDTVLLGSASPTDERHLAVCETCSDQLTDFRTSLAMFNQASEEWSRARSNTISRELPPRRLSHSITAAWSLASVTVLAVALAFTSQLHRSPELALSDVQQTQPLAGQMSNRQEEIASDNAMLVAIDTALSQPVQSPVAPDRTAASAAQESRQNTSREAHD